MSTPQAVLDALAKLDSDDKDVVLSYISELQSQLPEPDEPDASDEPDAKVEEEEEDETNDDEAPFPPLYESGDDFDKAGELKQEAAELKSAGNWDAALEKYTAAIAAAQPSALLYANRAVALLQLDRPRAAERDCSEALKENPDSAKALRTRGKARKAMGQWEAALRDLSASQQIDFDEGTVEDLKFLTEKHVEQEKMEAATRIKEEDRLRKKAADIKAARAEAEKEAAEQSARSMPSGMPGGMPGGMGGMPGGMGGMPGMPGGGGGMPAGMEGIMGAMMSDPELMAGMQNPKVQAAFQELMSGPGGAAGLMSNPAKLQELMSDPEVGPILTKLMAKLGGGAMPGGMPGGMGGMPNMGGDDDGIPNLDEMDDEVDISEMPDLE